MIHVYVRVVYYKDVILVAQAQRHAALDQFLFPRLAQPVRVS